MFPAGLAWWKLGGKHCGVETELFGWQCVAWANTDGVAWQGLVCLSVSVGVGLCVCVRVLNQQRNHLANLLQPCTDVIDVSLCIDMHHKQLSV